MHNKSFAADRVISIVGGRNVEGEYFGTGDGAMFAGMDVAVAGKIMAALNEDSDRYRVSERVYPADTVIPSNTKPIAINAKLINSQTAQQQVDELRQLGCVNKLVHHTIEFYWVEAKLISDNPLRTDENWEDAVTSQIIPYFQNANNSIPIVSPYLVPTDAGVVIIL